MWGQDIKNIWCSQIVRIIPTRVGTSPVNFCCWKLEKDHPHACGDKRYEFFTTDNATGSSPRVWGQEGYVFSSDTEPRIIPTRVGTSLTCNYMMFRNTDHPHACGDKLQM